MPSTAHEELARGDTRVPGLGTLLTPDALSDLLDSLLPADAERPLGVEVTHRRYRPGTGLATGFTARYPDGTRHAFARALAADAAPGGLAEEVRYARRWVPEPAGRAVDISDVEEPRLRGPLHDPGLCLVVGPPVDDLALTAVRHFASAPDRFGAPDGGSARTLAYRPGRRWVGRIDDADGRPVTVVRARSGKVNASAYLASAAAGIPVPDLVRISRYGLVATRWVPGEPLDLLPARGSAAGDATLAEAGRLLARLHSVPPPRELLPADLGAEATAAASEVGGLVPGLAGRAEAVALRCADALADPSGPRVLAHGGFRAARVLVGERGPALADLDRARVAHPAADLADFAAAEYAAGRSGDGPAAVLGPLLDGYLDEAPAAYAAGVLGALDAFTSAALLCRAAAPFRHGAPDWDTRAAALVALAEDTGGRAPGR
ncbi:phosphotransferase [Actinorugispora endophytica]|uniref:Phosphotransferase family enzyme n=1 Tax=Actinorugispora endophytica TaxID=1605990 RepID=A0A4R6ULR0_9ACTN|nr:phosphotransferase [Actinorugispora endophytica]TDQ47988.1 phosphotransferase family enzyme [Actinorugispora endophytica]